jgi:hypothetical protein
MTDVTFEEVLHLAEQLTPADQQALIERLRQHQERDREHTFQQTFGLLVFDPGPWPDHLTLRREDEYGDDER